MVANVSLQKRRGCYLNCIIQCPVLMGLDVRDNSSKEFIEGLKIKYAS